MSLFDPPLAALRQLHDPAFLRVLAASVLAALAAFVLLGLAIWLGIEDWLGWNSWLAAALGVTGAVLLAHVLFLPVAGAVAALFANPVAAAVERRFYPWLPPASPAPLAAQIWDGLVLAAQVLGLQLLALVLTPVSAGISLVAGYAVAAWAVGRGVFVAVAMRRLSRRGALTLYAARRGEVFAQGAFAVLASLVPIANLAVPVLVVAVMVHVLHARTNPPAGLARRGSV